MLSLQPFLSLFHPVRWLIALTIYDLCISLPIMATVITGPENISLHISKDRLMIIVKIGSPGWSMLITNHRI